MKVALEEAAPCRPRRAQQAQAAAGPLASGHFSVGTKRGRTPCAIYSADVCPMTGCYNKMLCSRVNIGKGLWYIAGIGDYNTM